MLMRALGCNAFVEPDVSIKGFLKEYGCKLTGNKPELLDRLFTECDISAIDSKLTQRRYCLTDKGKEEGEREENEYVMFTLENGNGISIFEMNIMLYKDNPLNLSYKDIIWKKYIKQAQAQGLSGEETTEFVNKKMHDHAMRNNQDYKTEYDKAQKTIDRKGLSAEEYKNFELAQEHRHNAEVATDRMKAIRTSNYMDEKGNMVPDFEKQMVANDARGLGGAIMKGLKDGMKDVGLNLSGLIGTFGRATNYKLDDKGKIDGVYGEAKAAATTQKELNDRREQSKLARGRFVDSLAGVMFGYGDAGKKEDAPKTGDKLGQSQLKEGEKQTKGIEDLGRKIDKLTDAILKGK